MSREDYHLPLQVKLYGQGFPRNTSGPKLHRFQLLHQMLQRRREGISKGRGNNYTAAISSQSGRTLQENVDISVGSATENNEMTLVNKRYTLMCSEDMMPTYSSDG